MNWLQILNYEELEAETNENKQKHLKLHWILIVCRETKGCIVCSGTESVEMFSLP